MIEPTARALSSFLADACERLFLGASGRLPSETHERPRAASLIYLCEGRHLWWALIEPTDPCRGRVAWSNTLPMGVLVKSAKTWPFAAMRRNPASPQTLVSPRFLKILWIPPRPKAGKGRCSFPLREFSLAA